MERRGCKRLIPFVATGAVILSSLPCFGAAALVDAGVPGKLADCDADLLPLGDNTPERVMFDSNGQFTEDPGRAELIGTSMFEDVGPVSRYCRHGRLASGQNTVHSVEFTLQLPDYNRVQLGWDEEYGVSASSPLGYAGISDKGALVLTDIGGLKFGDGQVIDVLRRDEY